MTKKEIVAKAAEAAGISKSKAELVMNTMLKEVSGAMKRGKKVTFVGFGTFYLTKRKARMGRNPRTGKAISIPASKLPKFKAGKALKDAVN
jgi:DNA-binding protein HU-beta